MNESPNPSRKIPLFAVIGLSLAAVGFVVGIREPARAVRQNATATVAANGVPQAKAYSELPFERNRSQHTLVDVKFEKPGLFDTVTRTDELKLAALADRAKYRAYDGAPPTVPHPVDSQSAASCLACHAEGLKIGDRVASKMSHALMTNCTQCHVEQATTVVETNFVGVHRAGPGERASPGAPPTIPHHTWMRENCTSCHGLIARAGTRTTHPWLTNCTQCHAPSAAWDRVEFAGGRK